MCDAQMIQIKLELRGSTTKTYHYVTEPRVLVFWCPVDRLRNWVETLADKRGWRPCSYRTCISSPCARASLCGGPTGRVPVLVVVVGAVARRFRWSSCAGRGRGAGGGVLLLRCPASCLGSFQHALHFCTGQWSVREGADIRCLCVCARMRVQRPGGRSF